MGEGGRRGSSIYYREMRRSEQLIYIGGELIVSFGDGDNAGFQVLGRNAPTQIRTQVPCTQSMYVCMYCGMYFFLYFFLDLFCTDQMPRQEGAN